MSQGGVTHHLARKQHRLLHFGGLSARHSRLLNCLVHGSGAGPAVSVQLLVGKLQLLDFVLDVVYGSCVEKPDEIVRGQEEAGD